MKRFLIAVGAVAIYSVAVATQETKPQNPRVDFIWNEARNKLVDQMDVWWDDGDYPRIIQLLKLSYATDPSDYEVATDLGWMLENIEQWDEALAVYIEYRKNNPGSKDAAFPEAGFYFRQKAYAKVPPILEPTIKLKPHRQSYSTLAHSYEKMGLLGDSKRVWKSYLADNPGDDTARNNLIRVERKIKGEAAQPAGRPSSSKR